MLVPILALLCAVPPETILAEGNRRGGQLVRDGYNLTQGFALEAKPEKTTDRFEFFLPQAGEEHRISFWAETGEHVLTFRLLSPDAKVLATWTGRGGDATVIQDLPVGKYTVELDRPPATAARALLGIRGPAAHRCQVDANTAIEHRPGAGFHWPYVLFMPKKVTSTQLIVAPLNTGFTSEDLELLRTAGSCEVRRQAALAERLGAPLLVPLFPRPPSKDPKVNLYLHALTRAALETRVEAYARVDLQLLAMIDDARAGLKQKGVELSAQVMLTGFSASGSFVNRFAVLHPDRVSAVAIGSPGGWPLAPLAQVEADKLPWPVGISDVEALIGQKVDPAQLKKVAFFFFLGDQDDNDAVPHRDSFSQADEELIFRRFGKTPVLRWKAAERLYSKAGLNARFTLYPGVPHSVTPQIDQDVAAFFEKAPKPAK